ncbi:MAG TPA: hypothetical protein VMG58_17805 [Candidatus Sulfotelmatobacter sp.]|nr:hypothetical protein [Candidatus Sulfotelmatobacter sp.]
MDGALKDGEARRAALVADLMPATLRKHLEGIAETLRNGPVGQVRDAIEQTVSKITVAADGTLTIEPKAAGLLGLQGPLALPECGGNGTGVQQTDPGQVSAWSREGEFAGRGDGRSHNGRRWKILVSLPK